MAVWGLHFLEFHSLVEPILGKSPWTLDTHDFWCETSTYVLLRYYRQIYLQLRVEVTGGGAHYWLTHLSFQISDHIIPNIALQILPVSLYISASIKLSIPVLAVAPLVDGHRDVLFQVLDGPL